MTAPKLLVAIDMDGTLLRDDKTIAEVDVAAIRAAASCGVAVTLATGRLTTGALPTAQQLALTTPLICADGGLLVDPSTGATLERRTIPAEVADAALAVLEAHGLAAYVFLADAIHCDESGARHRAYVATWSQQMVVHPSLRQSLAWRGPDGVSLTAGLGEQRSVEKAYDELRTSQAATLDTVCFSIGGLPAWAVRSLPPGCNKGEMLARLAQRLGLTSASVAAIGDWYNDVEMFAYAGRSFAMAQAPDAVRSAATDRLRASSISGGGVAEALEILMSGL